MMQPEGGENLLIQFREMAKNKEVLGLDWKAYFKDFLMTGEAKNLPESRKILN